MTDLTQKILKTALHYDPVSGIWTWLVRPTTSINIGDMAGVINSWGYRVICLGGQKYKAGRLAFLYMTGQWPLGQVDHINRERADDRWVNLREATAGQNRLNKIRPKSTGLPRGIELMGDGLYRVTLGNTANPESYLGNFHTLEEAKQVYLTAVEARYGLEFLPQEDRDGY